jgi:pSer/pThr/pTyr-binding forkhead associated (FHA) protein
MENPEQNDQTEVYYEFQMSTPDDVYSLIVEKNDFPIKIGTHKSCPIYLNHAHGDSISRLHAIVEYDKMSNTFHIIDMGSGKGTYVDEQKVNKCGLHNGSEIHVGDTIIRFFYRTRSENKEQEQSHPTEQTTEVVESQVEHPCIVLFNNIIEYFSHVENPDFSDQFLARILTQLLGQPAVKKGPFYKWYDPYGNITWQYHPFEIPTNRWRFYQRLSTDHDQTGYSSRYYDGTLFVFFQRMCQDHWLERLQIYRELVIDSGLPDLTKPDLI